MNNYYNQSWTHDSGRTFTLGAVNAFLQRVFIIMFAGLAITGVTSYLLGTYMLDHPEVVYNLFTGAMGWVIMLAPLAFVLVLSFGINRLSYPAASVVFALYAAVMGVSLSVIFLVYTMGSIFLTFFVTAATFGAMAAIGFFTKMDLTKLGTYLLMALIGVIIASVVNWFVGSSALEFIISIAGVVIFSGLTAYDVQRLKHIDYLAGDGQTAELQKMSIMGALSLYLNFINLFMFLLRLLGQSRD
jgi:FtsH-binding integral membrane protein